MRPFTLTVPALGFEIPAMTLRRVDFPEPFRPMTAKVDPSRTLKVTPSSAGKRSSGLSSLSRLPRRSALFSVRNCFRWL